jgi:HEAT repeat protein
VRNEINDAINQKSMRVLASSCYKPNKEDGMDKENTKRDSASPEVIISLIDELTCDDVIRCQNARRQLVKIGPKAVAPLARELSNKKQMVRWEVAKALGQIGGSEAIKVLIGALENNIFEIRWLAAEGLISHGREAIVPLLEELAKNSDSLWLREGAHHVLSDMYQGDLDPILKRVLAAIDGLAPTLEIPPAAKEALEAIQKSKGNLILATH